MGGLVVGALFKFMIRKHGQVLHRGAGAGGTGGGNVQVYDPGTWFCVAGGSQVYDFMMQPNNDANKNIHPRSHSANASVPIQSTGFFVFCRLGVDRKSFYFLPVSGPTRPPGGLGQGRSICTDGQPGRPILKPFREVL